MKIGVNFKIDVTKLDKNRFFKGKNGAVYADLTGFIDIENQDQYGNNGFITQQTSKEEREQGVKLPILGNSKVFYKDGGRAVASNGLGDPGSHQGAGTAPPQQAAPDFDEDDDIPF